MTALYLRSYLEFFDELVGRAQVTGVPIDDAVLGWLRRVEAAFAAHGDMHRSGRVTAAARRELLDELGRGYSDYRTAINEHGPGHATALPLSELSRFIAVVRPHLDLVASSAVRDDGLHESYLLLRLEPGRAHLEPLYEMLEGQVAALSSSAVELDSAVRLVDALFDSALYRPDQRSFMLYPDHRPPSFERKNVVPEDAIGPAVTALLDSDSDVVRRDDDRGGAVRESHPFGS